MTSNKNSTAGHRDRSRGVGAYILVLLCGLLLLAGLELARQDVRRDRAGNRLQTFHTLLAAEDSVGQALRQDRARGIDGEQLADRITSATRAVEASLTAANASANSARIADDELASTSRVAAAIAMAGIAAQALAGAQVDATQALAAGDLEKIRRAFRLADSEQAVAHESLAVAEAALTALVEPAHGIIHFASHAVATSLAHDDSLLGILCPMCVAVVVGLIVIGAAYIIRWLAIRWRLIDGSGNSSLVETLSKVKGLPTAILATAIITPFALTPLMVNSSLSTLRTSDGAGDLGRVARAIEASGNAMSARSNVLLTEADMMVQASKANADRQLVLSESLLQQQREMLKFLAARDTTQRAAVSAIYSMASATRSGTSALVQIESTHTRAVDGLAAQLGAVKENLVALRTAVPRAHEPPRVLQMLTDLALIDQCMLSERHAGGFSGVLREGVQWVRGKTPFVGDSLADGLGRSIFIKNHCHAERAKRDSLLAVSEPPV